MLLTHAKLMSRVCPELKLQGIIIKMPLSLICLSMSHVVSLNPLVSELYFRGACVISAAGSHSYLEFNF